MAHDHLWIYSNSADFILTDDLLKHTVEVYTKQCNWNQSTSLMKVERATSGAFGPLVRVDSICQTVRLGAGRTRNLQ
jgi:hypothetical protein